MFSSNYLAYLTCIDKIIIHVEHVG